MAEGNINNNNVKRLHTPDGTPPSHRSLCVGGHAQQVLCTLEQLYYNTSLCDYTIVAEGQSFRTHRTVLAAVSDYFRAMLTGSMIEARQDHVDLKGVTSHAVKLLLDFAYTGKLVLNLDECMEILAGACHLQMRTAIELCSDFLESELCAKTCVDILNISETFALVKVKDSAIEFIIENFEKIAELDQFYKIHREHLCVILQSNRLYVTSELELFNHVVQWVDAERTERCRAMQEIFQHIRFAMMKPEELVDQVSRTFVMSHPECRAFLDEALHYHLLPHRQPVMQTARTRVRNTPCMVAFGGRYGINIGYANNSSKMYALHEGKWLQLPGCDSNFLYAAVAVVDNFMYVCGGMGKPAHARSTCSRFDPRTCTWTKLAHMRTRRQSFPLVGRGGRLFAFGGGTPVNDGLEHPPTDRCEVYSIDKNEWSLIAPLPHKRKSASACEHGGRIYVSGGRTDDETVLTLWRYDVDRDTWEERASMLMAHAGHVMVPLKDRIYVVDRRNTGIECYNPITDDWTKVLPSLGSLSGVARPAVMGAWVYFISYVQDTDDFRCKRYNVVTSVCEELQEYPEHAHCVIGAPLALPRHLLVESPCDNASTVSTSPSEYQTSIIMYHLQNSPIKQTAV